MTKRKQSKGVPPTAADFSYIRSNLTYCCGVLEIGDFCTEEETYNAAAHEDEEINWSTIPTAMSTELREDFSNLGKTLIATTVLRYRNSSHGQDEVNKVLSRTGWKKVQDFTNKGTGSRLRMWIFTPTAKR